jgi:branched-chain amino acid transport system substrate-binding protein
MPKRYTKHQLFIGRSIWAGVCAYIGGSIIDWSIIGQPSPEWALTTLLAIIAAVLAFLAANEQVERAIDWMMQTWKAGVGFVLVTALAVAVLLVPKPFGDVTIKIGADLPLSGIDKANGEAVKKGIELAIKQENKANDRDNAFPYNFKLKVLDDVPDEKGTANAEVGKKNILSLVSDQQVAGIIGPYNTDVAIKEIPVVNDENNKIALLSPSTTAECLTGPKAPNQTRTQFGCDSGYLNGRDGKGSFFRIAAHNAKMGEVYAKCLAASSAAVAGSCPGMPHKSGQHYKHAVVIDDGSVFSVSLADSLGAEWNRVSTVPLAYGPISISQDRAETDIKAKLQDVEELTSTPDLLIFIGSYHNSEIFNKTLPQFSSLQTADVAFSTSIMNVSPTEHFLPSSQSSDRTFYSVAPLISLKDSINPNAQQFIRDYHDEYHVDPNPYSATGYDTARIVITAIKKAQRERTAIPNLNLLEQLLRRPNDQTKSLRQAVIDKIRDGSDYESAASSTGMYTFEANSNGDAKDAKSAAVSVFKWAPAHRDNQDNINGWDFQ